MEKCLAFVAYVNKTRIKCGKYFFYLGNVYIAYGIAFRAFLALIFYKSFVFKKSNGNVFGTYVYYYFA